MRRILIIAALFLLPVINLIAQLPVQVTPQLIPPYSLQVSDYYTPGASAAKLNLLLLLRDFNKPSLQVRLRMSISSQTVSISTKEDVTFTPITITSGEPKYLAPDELGEYFNSNKLNFSGITQTQYEQSGKLPEGFYTFCFEVVDVATGQTVSNKGCAIAWLTLSEPPLLNLPRNGESLIPLPQQNVLFQWTPRHTASPTAFSTEYVFSIYEVLPGHSSPEEALNTVPLYTDVISQTTYLYDISKPLLNIGSKYIWRVQAKAKNGTQELAMFRNNGYSEAFWFTYLNNCPEPTNIAATALGQRVDITWSPNTQHVKYKVEYRKTGNADAQWFEISNTVPRVSITDLEPGGTYEYRVGAACQYGSYMFSSLHQFTANDENATTVPNCGMPVNITPSSEPLLQQMAVGDIVKVGDFEVKVTKVEGNQTSFTGEGYVKVSWLANMKIGVKFTNITVTTDGRLKTGEIVTTYDPTLSGIFGIDEFFEGGEAYGSVKTGIDTTDYEVGFVIGSANNITVATGAGYDPNTGKGPATITITGANNENQVINVNELPVTIKDADGNTYQAGKDGTVAAIGKAGGAQLVNLIDKRGVDVDKARITFKNYPEKQKYGFDEHKAIYNKSSAFRSKYEVLKGDYYVPAKAIAAGEVDYLKAELTLTDPLLTLDSLRFVSGKGIIYQPKPLSEGVYEIPVIGAPAGDAVEVYAVLRQPGGKTLNLGKILVASYPEKNFTVKIVPVNNATVNLEAIKTAVNNTYNAANVKFDISLANNFTNTQWDLNGDGKMEIDAANLFTNYSAEMKLLHALFKATPDYSENTYYLFVLNEPSVPGLEGDMPRGGRFGYLFTNNLSDIGRTAAHELGHGALILKHTFDGEGFDANDLPDNIMDNGSGTHLTKHQWDFLHDPPFFVSVFDSEADGFAAGVTEPAEVEGNRTYVSPSGTPIKLPAGASIKLNKLSDLDLIPNGALYWFQLSDGKQYAANLGYYKSNMTGKANVYYEENDFDGYFPVVNGAIDYKQTPFSGFEPLTIQADRKVPVVVLYVATSASGCTLKRFIADYIVPTNVSLTIVNRKAVELNDEVENLTAPNPNPIPEKSTDCMAPYPPDPNNKYLEQYYNANAQKLKEWLSKKVKSSIKYYLYDCATNKAKYTITKEGAEAVPEDKQGALMDQYNTGDFSQDIAIKACIDQTGKWNYDFKYNKKVLDNAHPKVKPVQQQVLDEIRKQINEEMKDKKRFDQAAEPDYRENTGEQGEFYKEGMPLPKGLATFLDIGKNIYEEAKMPEYLWDRGKRKNNTTTTETKIIEDYKNSPIHLPGVLNGGVDRFIDEATGTVQLVKTGFQFIRHPKQTFKGIWNGVKGMSWEKAMKMVKDASGYDNYVQGGDRAQYQLGSHATMVAFAFGAIIKKLTEGTEIIEEAGKEMDKLDDFVVGTNADEAGAVFENARVYEHEVKQIDDDNLFVMNKENDVDLPKTIEKNGDEVTVTHYTENDMRDPRTGELGKPADVESGMKEVDPPTAPGKTEFDQDAGKSGEWNKKLNKPKANQVYKVDGGKFEYHTGEYTVNHNGVTKKVALTKEVNVPEITLKSRDRNLYQQKKCRDIGGVPGDDGGHLVGSQFNGPGERINMVPMSGKTNRAGGKWYQMESEMAAKLNSGSKIKGYNVKITYDGTGRPTKFAVSYKEHLTDGTIKEFTSEISNPL